MAEVETKTFPLSIRIRPSVKAMADRRAKEEDRSLASYIERLVLADAQLHPPIVAPPIEGRKTRQFIKKSKT